MQIDYEIKKRCVGLASEGKTSREIYTEYYHALYPDCSHESFKRSLTNWKRKQMADDDTLHGGTYPRFTAHDATVQINGDGKITQAWIKQNTGSDDQWERLIESIREDKAPTVIDCKSLRVEKKMLEIPLFDMHFPLGGEHYYDVTQQRIYSIIQSAFWDEINIPFGQDVFHNDDFEGRTTKGTNIEKVNMVSAWESAKRFYYGIISMALAYSTRVNLIYTKGNHDKSMAWAFMQLLKEVFPQSNVDDSMKARKCISWENCFIGIVHGCETKSKNNDLRGQFTIQFPMEFAAATVREIHCGHLHHEAEGDIYGVMIRRLSSGLPTDDWSDDSGYVGAHKRFMVFGWEPGRLASIYYV